MSLSRSFPIDSGFPNAVDLRRLDAGLIAREGVFPDPTTTAAAGIAVGTTAWNVQARPFVAALKRGGAPYSLSYGVARLANSAQVNAWEIQPAPASGSRIDLLWIRATDPGEGETTSGSDGPGGAARAVPIFGVTAGTPSGTPATPALPAGALLIATVTTPSGAASIAGSTIAQSYGFAHLVGGVAYYRTAALRDESTVTEGTVGRVIGDDNLYVKRVGSTWDRFLVQTGSQPFAEAAGSLSMAQNLANGSNVTTSITFPQGRFTEPPIISLSSNGIVYLFQGSVTASGFTLGVANRSGSALGAQGVIVHWTAVQMTPTSGAG